MNAQEWSEIGRQLVKANKEMLRYEDTQGQIRRRSCGQCGQKGTISTCEGTSEAAAKATTGEIRDSDQALGLSGGDHQ